MAQEQLANMPLPLEEQAGADMSVFKEAHVMTNTEVSHILQQYVAQKQERMGPGWMMPAVVKKTKEYVDKFSHGKNESNSVEIRRILVTRGFYDYEIGILANLMPESAEEAMVLVPSLAQDKERFTEDEIQAVLDEISRYRDFQ